MEVGAGPGGTSCPRRDQLPEGPELLVAQVFQSVRATTPAPKRLLYGAGVKLGPREQGLS